MRRRRVGRRPVVGWDGDPLTLVQSPASPYPLGTTPVLLTVTDPKGAFSQATGAVTVVDQTRPAIVGLSASPATLRPPNHKLVDVSVNYDTNDNCGASSCVLTITSNQPPRHGDDGERDDDRDKDRDNDKKLPDFLVVDAHDVRLRAERNDGRDRIYTITVTCTDMAGNSTVRTTTVVVPHDKDDDKDKDKGKDQDNIKRALLAT